MNSLRKSVGKKLLFVIVGGFLLTLVGCVSASKTDSPGQAAKPVKEALSGEISLKSDRSELDELRKEIPDQKKQSNDELALVLELFGEVKLQPSEVQQKYQQAARKRREVFRKKVADLRAGFKKQEEKKRNEFLKTQKQDRDSFVRKKADREKSKDFFAEQDLKNKEFFAAQRDRRSEFEAEIQSQSKDFDSYMREQMTNFNEQSRLYSKRFYEKKREEKLKPAGKAPSAAIGGTPEQAQPTVPGQTPPAEDN